MKFLWLCFLALVSFRFASMLPRVRRQTTINIQTLKGCSKERFAENYINDQEGDAGLVSGSTLYDEDYDNLKSMCSTEKPKCHSWSGTIRLSIVELMTSQTLRIRFQLIDLSKQDCWGHAVHWSFIDSSKKKKMQTKYFNFFEDFLEESVSFDFPTELETEHNFTVTPLPTGKPQTILIMSPSSCQLEVLNIIYDKIQREDILSSCDSMPSYDDRLLVAHSICSKTTTDLKRAANENIYEENCELKLKLGVKDT